MRLTDRRLWQARNWQDFLFRLRFRDADNQQNKPARREAMQLIGQFVAPDTNQIWGIDISHWDGNVDLSVTQEYGGKFVVVKAMDGTVPTRYWQENTARAKAIEMLCAPYAWLYPDNRVSCKLQAQEYWKLINGSLTVLPPVIDFEWTRYAGLSANPNYSDLDKWVTEFNRISGRKPILYSAAGYMNMFGTMPQALRAKFDGFWWASYGGLSLPNGFTGWDMWQFTANGDAQALAPGDTGKLELDLNYMMSEFYSRYSGAEEQPQEGNDMATYTGKAKATSTPNVRVRKTYPDGMTIGAIQPGQAFKGDRIEEDWMHVIEIGSTPIDGWSAAWLLDYTETTTPTPEPEPQPTPQPEPTDEVVVDVEVTATINGAVYRGTMAGLRLVAE